MKPSTWKGDAYPLGYRREADRDGFHQRNEPKDIRISDRSGEPLSVTLRNHQFIIARALRRKLRNVNGPNGRTDDGEAWHRT